MANIYLVEDEIDLSNLVIKYLEKEGNVIRHFVTGEEALEHIKDDVDLWILDIMLPGNTSGYDLIKEIRQHSTTPVIFTSARDQDIDRVLGLELGGDDYLAKPYSLRELTLRVKNILTRFAPVATNLPVMIGPYEINEKERSVKYNGVIIELTSKEYELLSFLLTKKSEKFSRDEILYAVWGDEYTGSNRVVDDLMRRLRNKLPHLRVETLYGYGYRLL